MAYMTKDLADVNTPVYGHMMTDHLTKWNWIDRGLRTLSEEGPNALKIAPMAATLKVSRGSFYWHFRDIADFRAQLLRGWQERATEQVIREIEADDTEPDRLKHLLRRAFVAKPLLDRAIRSWAAQDEIVAASVAEVDARRVGYIANLLIATGVESRLAADRAAFLYWAFLGQAVVMDPRHASIRASTIDDIGDLFER